MNLITNRVSPTGGLTKQYADAMHLPPNLLPEFSLAQPATVAGTANTGGDVLTSNHIRNWMECVRSRQAPHAPIEAGYSHSIANIMTTAAHPGLKATFDKQTQEVLVGVGFLRVEWWPLRY